MNITYTNSPEHCLQANIIIETPATDQKSIKDELASMAKDSLRMELLTMVPELAKTRTPDQLRRMREKAMNEVEHSSPMVKALVDIFFSAAISCSMELVKNENTAPGGNPEAVKSDRIALEQDDSISCSA